MRSSSGDPKAPARRGMQPRRRAGPHRGVPLRVFTGTATLLLALGALASPVAVEPTGEALAALLDGWSAVAALPAAAREGLSQRFPRFHHAAAPAHAVATPVARRVVAAAAPAATHRLDAPNATLAARFAPIPSALEAVIAEAGTDGGGLAPADEDAPEIAGTVPLPQAADAIRKAALGDGDMAALVVPLPTLRPDGLDAEDEDAAPIPAAPERPQRAAVPVLAYARPDSGVSILPDMTAPASPAKPEPAAPGASAALRLERGTAIYDISAATVYLPNGERLEAHSGLGSMRDNVRFVKEKMRGPTPPHTYDLTMRESLFHGVQALRLNPVGGERNVFNRVGLLAHTYMLGPKGDSNGCVSFKDYKRFLAAYQRGEVRRLVVVDKMSPASVPKPSLLARLLRAAG